MSPDTISPAQTLPPVSVAPAWSFWQKLLFRFTTIDVSLYIVSNSVSFMGEIPLLNFVSSFYYTAEDWLVSLSNDYLFHIKDQLVPLNGSGDTSYGYAQLCLFLLLAGVGTIGWTLLDKCQQYNRLWYWFLICLRYFVAMIAILYGSIKVFGQQMVFPSISQLATPLGDLLPMRFSWLFIGYSTPYQFFSGAVEVVAGALLLWRRTATLGAFVSTTVFLNVMMLNLCYDIPVKLFSMHLFVFSILLMLGDARRLLNFFIFNEATQPKLFLAFHNRRARITRLILKAVFIVLFGIFPFYQAYQYAHPTDAQPKPTIKSGYYEVAAFESNLPDSLRWQNVIFEETPLGSIQTSDSRFRQRYGRGYFVYSLDSTKQFLSLKKDTITLMKMRISRPDTNLLSLHGLYREDSLHVVLRRTNRHFQLAERQFHWLSEANR